MEKHRNSEETLALHFRTDSDGSSENTSAQEIEVALPSKRKSITESDEEFDGDEILPRATENSFPLGEISAPGTESVSLSISISPFASGMNSALNRFPEVKTNPEAILHTVPLSVGWSAHWKKPKVISITFPEGVHFLTSSTIHETSAENEKLENISPVVPIRSDEHPEETSVEEESAVCSSQKSTRIKPPADTLTLEDRLFYVLQPPLESWLKGQELIMPFEPFPHQYEGIAWLFSQEAALLADEMGLGKTMQTITAIRLLLRAGRLRRILLVCPKPLIPNWEREIRFWAEELPFVTVEGDFARRKMIWNMPGMPVLLANYELLVRDFENMSEEDQPCFDLVVLDEAQRIKNRNSRTAETARNVTTDRTWALTGTPIENNIQEMASLYEFMQVIPENSSPDLQQLTRLSDRYVLRRTKDLVMKDLPPRLDRDAFLELAPAQATAYKMAEKEGVLRLNEMGEEISIQHVFELVLRLKQITNYDPMTGDSCKRDRLRADMEEIASSGGKAILFSQWTRTLDWLGEQLSDFQPLIYHGGVPSKKREPILSRFEHDPSASLLLMSYGTGAVGLNLQFAGYVFLYDRWWNPAVEDQAINRAHRIGQKSQVIVTKFICQETIEERIDKVLQQKRDLFRAVLGDQNTNASMGLNAADIFGLFDLKARSGNDTKPVLPDEAA